MATLAPTAEVLEGVYQSAASAQQRIFEAELASVAETALAQSVRHLASAVELLADLVGGHLTAPDVERHVEGPAPAAMSPASALPAHHAKERR